MTFMANDEDGFAVRQGLRSTRGRVAIRGGESLMSAAKIVILTTSSGGEAGNSG
jgi:hypothetical protein